MTFQGLFIFPNLIHSLHLGHPWIFRSAEDGERMDIQKSEKRVHYPHTAPSKRAPANNGRDLLQAVLIKSPKVECEF